jgi:predicted Co/Zn/Cd cation transporter (cation efflux family)
MRTIRTILRFAAIGFAFVVLCWVAVRVSSHHSPTVDILGSYFPAWMICILSGLTLTFIAHWLIQLGKLKPYVGPAALIYSCLMIIFTFATWILFYQN